MLISRVLSQVGKKFQPSALRGMETEETTGKSNVIVMMLEAMFMEKLNFTLNTETQVFISSQISNLNTQSTTVEDDPSWDIQRSAV